MPDEGMQGFSDAMYRVYEQAKSHGYVAHDYKVMLDRVGPLETAIRCVLKSDGLPSGVLKLMELGIPEISVEAVVVEFADQLSHVEGLVPTAQERLRWMSDPEVQAKAKAMRASLQSPTSR